MILSTPRHNLAVEGLEYDPHSLQPATLAGFDSITINGTLTLSYAELTELPLSLTRDIWAALECAAQAECESWEREAQTLRAWLRERRG